MVIDYSQTINRFTALDAHPLPRIDQQVNELAKCKWFSTLDLKSAYYQVPLATEDRAYAAFEADGKLYQYCRLPFGVTNGVSCFQRIIDSVIADNDLKQTFAYLTILPSVVSTKLIMIAILRSFLTPRQKLTSLSMTRNLLLPLLKLTFLGTAYLRDP